MCESTKAKFRDLMPKVTKQASLETNSNSRLRNAMRDIEGSGRCTSNPFFFYLLFGKFIGEDIIVALVLMVYMFPEARSKADSNRVIYFTKVCIYMHFQDM